MKIFSLIALCAIAAVAKGCVELAYSPHPSNCNKFFRCVHGQNILKKCGAGLHWNQRATTCDYPANAGCTANGREGAGRRPNPNPNPNPAPPPPTGQRPRPNPGPNSSGASDITWDEFRNAVTSSGYREPSRDQYNFFIRGLPRGGITRKIEAAMALAQFLHESGGLLKKREDGCAGSNGCAGRYPDWNTDCEVPGQSYYGRGYIQLTYCSNYRAASRFLGLGDQLAQNPDRVAQSEELSWGVSFYYWKNEVQPKVGRNNEAFGRTTKAINGQREECQGRNLAQSQSRFRIYTNVFRAFRIPGQPNESGCYN